LAVAEIKAADLRRRVLSEWARVIRPRGLVFLVMHNDRYPPASSFFETLGWKRVDALAGEPLGETTAFQEYLSSG
jgi:ubiquinone/menaquinone biosynthesis C-methylase UbiE